MLEPFVFIAILAQYIEFPAIQDLIYTKICLQVLSDRKLNSIQFDFISDISTTKRPHLSESANTTISPTLPQNGRIQELNVSTKNATSLPILSDWIKPNNTDFRPLCSRINATNVPKDIRQEILHLDSLFWLKYQLVICIISALTTPYWGGISDKIGRLIPLNVPVFASLVCNLLSLCVGVIIHLDYSLYFATNWLFIGALLIGISGGQSVLISNTFSYLSDNTSSEERTKRVTILESIIFMAHSLGFYLSKLMMSLDVKGVLWLNKHFIAFTTCVALNFICLMYSICNLRHRKFHRFLNNFEREQREITTLGDQLANTSPKLSYRNGDQHQVALPSGERLRELTASTPDDPEGPVARADKSNWTFCDTIITFRYFKDTYSAAMRPRDSRAIILLLLFAGLISSLSLATLMSLLFIYVKMDPFNWTTSQYSQWQSLSSISRGVALIMLTLGMKFYSGWSVPDQLVATLGFLSRGAGLLLIGLADDSSLLYWSLASFALSEYTMPPIRSLLSKLVVNEDLCKIYSCLGSLQNMSFIIGNAGYYVALNYSATPKNYYRLSFIFAAVVEFGAATIMLMIYTSLRRRILVT